MNADQTDLTLFAATLKSRKATADTVIKTYWDTTLPEVNTTYGEASRQTMSAFTDILNRGGKRFRAALAESGYRMFGGTNQKVIDQMSLVLEMVHAYLLVTDDISDRSELRRGGPTAHRILEEWFTRTNQTGDRQHFGASLATLAAMAGMHQAMIELNKIPVDAERVREASNNLNHILFLTCQGQMNDLWNETTGTSSQEQIENVLIWKSACYSFVNPLQLGAILAGATPDQLKILEDYGRKAGRGFQLSDDVIGLFGSADETGKLPMDDLREGKRTLLIGRTLELASKEDANFLNSQLGNERLTEADFERCRAIIAESGALDQVKTDIAESCDAAKQALNQSDLPSSDEIRFLSGLADFLKTRKA
ncbi:MAG TPA: polyprenyl synthetase family protein [Candidatus Saccharimonadales bacterium]|nr:polyprenyl synthetase family protein [Candidatus Saccharimonadales bacterium]